MSKKKTTDITIILDESGSMLSIKRDTIGTRALYANASNHNDMVASAASSGFTPEDNQAAA